MFLSWFKRLFKKLGDEPEYEENERNTYIENDANEPAPSKRRGKFRFPLISDEEAEVYEEGPEQGIDPVASDEPPGLRAALRGRIESGAFHATDTDRIRFRAGMPESASSLRGSGSRETLADWQDGTEGSLPGRSGAETGLPRPRRLVDERPKPPVRTRGFKPSEIPSPVYGFGKRPADAVRRPDPEPVSSPETELAGRLREREERPEESRTEEDAWKKVMGLPAASLPAQEPARSETAAREDFAAAEATAAPEAREDNEILRTEGTEDVPGETPDSGQDLKEIPGEILKPDSPADEPAVSPDMAEKPEATVRQHDSEEDFAIEQGPVEETEAAEKTALPRKTGSPFNVVMLKTDKERLQKMEQMKKLRHGPRASRESGDEALSQEQAEAASPAMEPEKDPVPEPAVAEPEEAPPYYMPPGLDFLDPPEEKGEDTEWMEAQAATLEEALSYFAIKAKVIDIVQGPSVTRFELTVGHGTKVSKIRNLQDDLKLALAARDIRIQAPIPGKSSIGIEIPNRISRPVRISELIGSPAFNESDSPLEAALGLDLAGRPATVDLRKMPHGLIAGATGSGKSVCINSILTSLLYKASPDELRLLLIDPKMVELAPYNRIPHLVSPVITDVKAANAALKWAVEEMERRYELFAHAGVRDITRFNRKADEHREFSRKLPYLLIVIDELADLMMVAPAEVEESVCRIAQKARACGIHLIIATQRPSVDVITGLIKANIPARIAFSVSSQVDSRTIIDVPGAERLLGKGDMLYLGNGMPAPARLQGTFVTDDEIERVTDFVRRSGEPEYLFHQEELLRETEAHEAEDPLFAEACSFIADAGSASTSMLQRKFSIGYNRAARLIDMLEARGYVSPQKGSKPRDVYLTASDGTAEPQDGPAHTI